MGQRFQTARMAAKTFLLGSAVGLVGGLLLAPQSGKESRAKLKRKAQDGWRKATKTTDQAKNATQHAMREEEPPTDAGPDVPAV